MSLTAAALVVAAMNMVPGLSPERAERIVDPIVAVTDDPQERALLLVTNRAESTFRVDVETCQVSGDHGKAFTSYQLHPWLWGSLWGRRWACSDPQLAARLALFALGSRGSIRSRIARFMGRSPGDKQVLWRERLVNRIIRMGNDNRVAQR